MSSPVFDSINEDIDNLVSKRDFIHYAGQLQLSPVKYTHRKFVPEQREWISAASGIRIILITCGINNQYI